MILAGRIVCWSVTIVHEIQSVWGGEPVYCFVKDLLWNLQLYLPNFFHPVGNLPISLHTYFPLKNDWMVFAWRILHCQSVPVILSLKASYYLKCITSKCILLIKCSHRRMTFTGYHLGTGTHYIWMEWGRIHICSPVVWSDIWRAGNHTPFPDLQLFWASPLLLSYILLLMHNLQHSWPLEFIPLYISNTGLLKDMRNAEWVRDRTYLHYIHNGGLTVARGETVVLSPQVTNAAM